MACDTAETDLMIKNKLKEIQRQRKKIMEYIINIDDSLMRQIMFYKHISCMEWNEVADSIGGGNTGDSVRMLYNRYMQREESRSVCSADV